LNGEVPRDLLGRVRATRKLPRDERGVVVPGNTVRGMARSNLERWLGPADYPSAHPRERQSGMPGGGKIFNPKPGEPGGVFCVKDLFGEASRKAGEKARASRVFFSDFVLPTPEAEKYVVKILPPGESFELEVARKGATFEGFLLGDGLKPWEIGMLAFALGYRGDKHWGVCLLGRYKRSDPHYGRVTFSIDDPRLESYYKEFVDHCRDKIGRVEEDRE